MCPSPTAVAPSAKGQLWRRLRARSLTTRKLPNWRRYVEFVPPPEPRKRGVSQRTAEIGPDPRLMAQILRLAVAPVEPRKCPEQPRVALRRHDGVKLGERRGIEGLVGRAPRLDVAREQRKLEVLGHIDPRVLEQRHQIVRDRAHHGVLEVDDAYSRNALPFAEPDQIRGMEISKHPGSRSGSGFAQQIAPDRDELGSLLGIEPGATIRQVPFEHQPGFDQ